VTRNVGLLISNTCVMNPTSKEEIAGVYVQSREFNFSSFPLKGIFHTNIVDVVGGEWYMG